MRRTSPTIHVGDTYGLWTVVTSPWRNARGFLVVGVACSCSPEHEVVRDAYSVYRGDSGSCGCRRMQASRKAHLRHGQSSGKRTRIYRIWRGMRQRCLNKNNPIYKGYGERGITITPRWSKFENFWKDMGDPPSKRHSLGRIDNDGPYSKANCEWQTADVQCNNTRSTRHVAFEGRTASLTQWAREYGLPPHTLRARLEANWDIRRALQTPIRPRNTT